MLNWSVDTLGTVLEISECLQVAELALKFVRANKAFDGSCIRVQSAVRLT